MVGFEKCEGEDCEEKIPKVPKPVRDKYDGQKLCEECREKFLTGELDEDEGDDNDESK